MPKFLCLTPWLRGFLVAPRFFYLVVTGLVHSRIRAHIENMDGEQTQQIKKMIQYRVKYRVSSGKKRYCPGRVVPHPANRGGDPMALARLRELGGTLTLEGYDSVEANSNGVVVQEMPGNCGGGRQGIPGGIFSHDRGRR